MSNERRYQGEEIREILELAGRDDPDPSGSGLAADGITASELQAIGREIGVAPARIARAVREFEGRGSPVLRQSTLGVPTALDQSVMLARAPTDAEWELLVAELRTTFRTSGEIRATGGLREWSHGTLHAFIEPTAGGHRLRLTDSRAGALVAAASLGGFFLAFAVLVFLVLLGKTDPGFRFVVPVFFGLTGAGMVAGSMIALPGWASRREAQMQHITRYASTLLGPAEAAERADGG